MKKSMYLCVMMVIAVSLIFNFVVPSVFAASKTVTLRASFYQPPTHRTVIDAEEAFANLEELTDGRVKMEIYHSSTLCKPPEIWDALNRGMVDFSTTVMVSFRSGIPWWGCENIPEGPRNYWGMNEAAKHGMMEMYQQGLYSKGMKIKIAGMFCAGLGHIMTKGKRVATPDDMKGLKILAPGPREAEMLKALGASPVMIHFSEIYEALMTGLIDGSWGNMSLFGQFKAQEPAEYLCMYTFGGPYVGMMLSEKGLSQLSKADQAIVIDSAKKFALMQEIFSSAGEIPLLQSKIAPNLKEVVYPTPEQSKQWDAALAPVLENFKKQSGEQGRKAMEILKKYNNL